MHTFIPSLVNPSLKMKYANKLPNRQSLVASERQYKTSVGRVYASLNWAKTNPRGQGSPPQRAKLSILLLFQATILESFAHTYCAVVLCLVKKTPSRKRNQRSAISTHIANDRIKGDYFLGDNKNLL
jgi:hypothetical protein